MTRWLKSPQRPTVERLSALRAMADRTGLLGRAVSQRALRDAIAEIDALTCERDEAQRRHEEMVECYLRELGGR